MALPRRDGPVTVILRGELDLATATELEQAIDDVLASGHYRIRVDLSGLEFCDSVGLNGLVRARNRCRERGGNLEVINARDEVAEVISIAGLLNSLTSNDH